MGDQKTPWPWHWSSVIFFVMGMLSIIMLLATYRTSEGLRKNLEYTDAIESIIIKATRSHLWLDQAVAGRNAAVDITAVWADLDEALRLSAVMLEGGESEHGMVVHALKDPGLRAKVEDVRSLLSDFKTVLMERHQEPPGSPLIPAQDKRSDSLFKEFLSKTTDLEILFEQRQLRGQKVAGNLFSGILVVWMFIVAATTAVLWNRDRRRREMEDALRRSEERFRITLAHSPVAVFSQDRNLRYTWVYNPPSGLSPGEMIGKTDAGLAGLEDAERMTAIKRRVLETGRSAQEGIRFTTAGGSHYFDLSVEPLRDPAGAVTGVTCIAVDVTRRRQAEEELRKHRERLEDMVIERTTDLLTANAQLQQEILERENAEESMRIYQEIIEKMPMGVLVWHLEDLSSPRTFRLIAANPAVTEISGLQREDFMGKTLFETLPALERTDLPEAGATVVRSGKPVDLGEVFYQDERIPASFFLVKLFPLPGNCLGTIFDDVSERRRAADMLRDREDRLRDLSQQFHTVLEAITDPLTLLSPELRVLWGNQRALGMAGSNVSDLAGHFCYTLWHGRSAPCEECPVAKTLQTGKEESARLQDRRGRLWELRAFPVKDEEGKVGNVLTVASDVTERLSLEAETRRVAHLASLGELAAGVAHEINNPVNGIINYAQILSNKSVPGSREKEIAASIIKEGDRIANIVKSLLSFARAGRSEKNPARVHDILMDSLSLTAAQMRKDGITLEVLVPPDLPEVFAHPQQIQQVFLNIINNARYALNQRYQGISPGKLLEIRGEQVTLDNRPFIRITFYDRGTGIPGEVLGKVMNPFFSTKPRGKGTGLGLSISHGIVTDHGGRLTIESAVGHFTRVHVDLPVKEDGANVSNSGS